MLRVCMVNRLPCIRTPIEASRGVRDMVMIGVLILVAIVAFFIVAIIVMDVAQKEKEDGQVINLADFEYDSKKQIFKKKKVEEEDEEPDYVGDPSYSSWGGNSFNHDD